jgi:hypothetical protein
LNHNDYRGWNYAREVSSVQLNTYIRQRGWSLPDYDENNNVIVGGVVVVRESETIRKRSLALLETTLCRWAASIEIEKNNENKTKTIATTTTAAATTANTSIDDISNSDSMQRPRGTYQLNFLCFNSLETILAVSYSRKYNPVKFSHNSSLLPFFLSITKTTPYIDSNSYYIR